MSDRVDILREGPLASIGPEAAPLVAPALATDRHAFGRGGPRGFTSRVVREAPCECDAEGRLTFPAGLVRRVAGMLKANGLDVRVVDVVPDEVERRTIGEIPGLADAGVRLLGELDREPRGRIRVGSASGMASACSLLTRHFHRAPIALVAPTRDEAWRARRRLARAVGECVGLVCRGPSRTGARVEVGTLGSLDLQGSGVVVFLHAEQALGLREAERLASLARRRVYGLDAGRGAMGPRMRLRLEGLLGPVLGDVGGPDVPKAGPRVVMASWACPDLDFGDFGPDWKRAAIWRHSRRSDVIAAIATSLAEGDGPGLWRHGIFLDGADRPHRVTILVESPEHAAGLAALLPGWRTLAGRGDDGPASPEGGRDGAPGPGDSLDRAIVTLVRASSLRRLATDVLIRADGTPWPLNLPEIVPGPNAGAAGPAIVVDLLDDFDRVAGHATRRRMADYRDRHMLADGHGRGSSLARPGGVHGPGWVDPCRPATRDPGPVARAAVPESRGPPGGCGRRLCAGDNAGEIGTVGMGGMISNGAESE